MKKFLYLLIIIILPQITFGQRIYSVVFDNLPQDYQLYPRTDKNEAIVAINGQIEVENWKYLSVVVFRNKALYQYQRSEFKYNVKGNLGNFDLKPTIKSELAEYDFHVYASQNGKDSVLLTERKNIVAGDAYLIYGQSNGRAWEVDYKYRNEYARTYGFGSQSSGYAWGLSNSGFTGGYDGEQNIVGEWGIEFQRAIAENYGIPTCVINASTSGANIKALSDRNPNNPADYNTLYGRLLDFAKKTKLIDNIKGFFYWQAETDAAQNPTLWKPGFDQLYKYWQQDFPSVKKFYLFQIPLFGAGDYNDEVGVLRDYLRKLSEFYPKVTSYAPIGAGGWNGWHFELDGYIQIGKELGKIVGYDFYKEKKKIFSPNIRKAFYSTKERSEITLAFEDGQQMLYPNDSIVPKIGGGFMNSSLKNFFYINGEWQKVASGRAEANRVVLKLKKNAPVTDTLINYLPSIYPYSAGSYVLQEAPWIYIGPFLKNTDGMRAFVFHNYKIAPFQEFQAITLKNSLNENKKVTLQWNAIDGAVNYVLERVSGKDSTDIQLVVKLSGNITAFSDTTINLNTEYLYRIKAVNNLAESPFAVLKIKTINDLNTLRINAEVNYYNTVTISWTSSPSFVADYYILERKRGNDDYKQISRINLPTLRYIDSTLQANTKYTYRLKAYNATTQSSFVQVEIETPSLLAKPDLAITILYYNSLKINWKLIAGAITYKLERKSGNEEYKQIALLDSKSLEWIDKDLLENTFYSYRLEAFGDKTESLVNVISVQTPAILNTPELTAETITHENVKLKWKLVTNANKYVLERQSQGETIFQKILETDNLLEYTDTKVKENTNYSYRLKALSNISESRYIKIDLKTLAILSNQSEENATFNVFPNPASEQVTISFLEPIAGNLSFVDLLGKTVFEQKIAKQKSVEINVSTFKKGFYLVLIKTNQELYIHKVIIE